MTRGLEYPLEISLGFGEPARAWCMDVIQDRDSVDGPLGCQWL